MKVYFKSKAEIEKLHEANQIVCDVLDLIRRALQAREYRPQS